MILSGFLWLVGYGKMSYSAKHVIVQLYSDESQILTPPSTHAMGSLESFLAGLQSNSGLWIDDVRLSVCPSVRPSVRLSVNILVNLSV